MIAGDYVRTLDIGLNVAINLRGGARHATASLSSACLKSSLIVVCTPDDIYVQPRFGEATQPTLWMGSLSIDVTREEATDIQAFIDRARRAACQQPHPQGPSHDA